MTTRGTVNAGQGTNAAGADGASCGCRYYKAAPDHHDLLLGLEQATFDALTSVVELAVTWTELDYSQSKLIAPDQWLDFAAEHRWENSDRVIDFFLAAQGLRGTPAVRPDLAVVLPLQDDGQPRCSRSDRAATTLEMSSSSL